MIRGLSQGSVLGRIPWNLGYNQVLEAIPVRVQVICYTNDPFVIAGSMEWTWTLRLTERGLRHGGGSRHRENSGLGINDRRPEDWSSLDTRTRYPRPTWLALQKERIRVKDKLKYLGITLDRCLRFDVHFDRLAKGGRGCCHTGPHFTQHLWTQQ